jgi:hypothetical protein
VKRNYHGNFSENKGILRKRRERMQFKNPTSLVDEPSQPGPERRTPANQQQNKGPRSRWKILGALVLLCCIAIGGFFIIRGDLSSTPSVPGVDNGGAITLSKPWCAAPSALSTSFAGTSLSGHAENAVWSAGANQVTYWDGHGWSIVYQPPSQQDVLRSLAEVAPNNVWLVGEQVTNGLPSHTLTIHWSGSGWQVVKSPDAVAGGKNTLVAVAGSSANDVWAVGFVVPPKGAISPLIEHWNGTQWSLVTPRGSLTGAQFTAIKALSSTDVWAVGYQSILVSGKTLNQPVTEHWNGKNWSAVTNPDLRSSGGGSLYGVGGSSANDLWAVGSANQGMLTEHWDGKSWSVIASPSVAPDSGNWLASVAASAPDNVWAVGRVGNASSGFQSFIEHWDGHQWQVVQDPDPGAGELDSVTALGNQFWIVGLPKASGGHAFIETLCP